MLKVQNNIQMRRFKTGGVYFNKDIQEFDCY